MRNQYSKYKNLDGSKKTTIQEVEQIGSRFYEKLGLQFSGLGRGSNAIKSKKPKTRMIKISRKVNRIKNK